MLKFGFIAVSLGATDFFAITSNATTAIKCSLEKCQDEGVSLRLAVFLRHFVTTALGFFEASRELFCGDLDWIVQPKCDHWSLLNLSTMLTKE